MFVAVPDIEENLPLPTIAAEAMPALSPTEELDMRVRTIKLLADIQGVPIEPTEEHISAASEVARQMMENPKYRPDYSQYPNETMAYLAGLVAQSNCMIVDELSDLKLYVVNKLVQEVEEAKDSKARISALKLLGEVDGVDAYKKRTESTITYKPIQEVEQELITLLENVEYRVLNEEEEDAYGVITDKSEPSIPSLPLPETVSDD